MPYDTRLSASQRVNANLSSFNPRSSIQRGLSSAKSGLDVEAMVEAQLTSYVKKIESIEDKKILSDKKIAAYQEMASTLQKFYDSLNPLYENFDVEGEQVFSKRMATVTNSDDSSVSYVTATANHRAQAFPGKFSISITSLATAKSQRTTHVFPSNGSSVTQEASGTTNHLFRAGTFQLRSFASDPWTNVSIKQGDSLLQIAYNINAVSASSGVISSVIATDVGYRLHLESTRTGADYAYAIQDPQGVFNYVALQANTPAADAVFNFAGEARQSPSNVVDEVITGVSITLKKPTGAVQSYLSIDYDKEAVFEAVANMFDAYDEFRIFYARMNEREPGQDFTGKNYGYKESAILARDSLLESISSQLSTLMSRMVSGLPKGALSAFSMIGISQFSVDATKDQPAVKDAYKIDKDTFMAALAKDFDAVGRVFYFHSSSSDSKAIIYKHPAEVGLTSFSLDINPARTGPNTSPAILSYTKNGLPVTMLASYDPQRRLITLPQTSPFPSMQIIWMGTSASVVSFSDVTQGIADLLRNELFLWIDTSLSDATEIPKPKGRVWGQIEQRKVNNPSYDRDYARAVESYNRQEIILRKRYDKLQGFVEKAKNVQRMLDPMESRG